MATLLGSKHEINVKAVVRKWELNFFFPCSPTAGGSYVNSAFPVDVQGKFPVLCTAGPLKHLLLGAAAAH